MQGASNDHEHVYKKQPVRGPQRRKATKHGTVRVYAQSEQKVNDVLGDSRTNFPQHAAAAVTVTQYARSTPEPWNKFTKPFKKYLKNLKKRLRSTRQPPQSQQPINTRPSSNRITYTVSQKSTPSKLLS